MSVKNRNSIVTDGLVFYVDAGNEDSYPGSGTTLTDLKGGVSGTLNNGPTYSSSNGGGITLDGANDNIDLGTIGSTIPSDFSWSFWLNTKTFSGGGNSDSCLILMTRDNSNSGYWILPNATELKFTLGGISNYIISYSLSTNTIYNICFTISGTTWKAYVDGTLAGTQTISSSRPQSNYRFWHGVVVENDGTLRGDNGDSTLYAASYYDKALSADEITQNYNALKNRFI